MLAQPKLLSWSSTKSRIHNRIEASNQLLTQSLSSTNRAFPLASRIAHSPLFSSHACAKYQFDTRLKAFAYYRSVDEDDPDYSAEDMLIASLYYNNPRDPHAAIYVYFTALHDGTIRRCLKHDFQFPAFDILKYVPKLKIVIGYHNNSLYILSNKNGQLKYLISVSCPGKVRRIIYDKTTRDIIYVGGDQGLFVRWYLVRDQGVYDLRLAERLKTVFINRQQNIIDMKLDSVSHKLFITTNKGCLLFDTLLNRESHSVLSAHGAAVTCANVYGFTIIMGFADGVMKVYELGAESISDRYQIQAHQASMIGLLITADGVIVTASEDGTVCFHALDTLIKLGEHRFPEAIERMMFVRGEDLLIKFQNDLQLLTYTLPVRSFSIALQVIEQARVTFPVGSIPSRVVTRSAQNLFTVYNPRSTQILNVIPLSPDRIVIQDFVYDTAGDILYILTNKNVCSYHCATQPSYLLNIFEVKEACFFTKLSCIMWFSLLAEHTKKRRAFGVVFVGTTNGKLYLVPGDHGLEYALLPDSPEAMYSYFQILRENISVDWLGVFQTYENYTTQRGARYVLAVGNDFVARFYRLSINEHEIYLRELGTAIHLDAGCIDAAIVEQRLAIACAQRGYIRMYAMTLQGLDEIFPKDLIYEHSPIKSVTGCESSGLFASLNSANEIILWTRNNEAVRKLLYDVTLLSIANLNDRGDLLLVATRRLYFLMMSDFAPEQILYDLSKKHIKDDPIEAPVQVNKNFNPKLLQSAQTVRLDERAHPQIPLELTDQTETLGFFEALEQDRIRTELTKMAEQKKEYPIAPDALIPNSSLRSMFKIKEVEPIEIKMFQLRLSLPQSADGTAQNLSEELRRFAVLNQFNGIHSNVFPLLNKIDILENLQSKSNKNLNWQNDDDEWVEMDDPDVVSNNQARKASVTTSAQRRSRPSTTRSVVRPSFFDELFSENYSYNFSWDEETIPEIFKRMKIEPWWKLPNTEENDNLRSMLLYLIEVLKMKEKESYEPACQYLIDVFRTYGIEPALINQILSIFIDHLQHSNDDPLDIHTVRTMAKFMIERKDVVVSLLEFAVKCESDDVLRREAIDAVKYITDVNSNGDIDLVLGNMPIVWDAADDSFSLKVIIDRIKAQKGKIGSDVNNNGDGQNDPFEDILHPLLKKISEERWYPRDNLPISLDRVIDAILSKLPNASKIMLKNLTSYLVQLNRHLGFSEDQYSRVVDALITLLSHNDADYRLIAATVLAELGRETKAVDIALLTSFINDPRILVRTECCDALKKITGIMSDTVLKDCAEDLPILETLSEEGFTLQKYLDVKNHVPTPPPPPPEPIPDSTEEIHEEERRPDEEEEVDTRRDADDQDGENERIIDEEEDNAYEDGYRDDHDGQPDDEDQAGFAHRDENKRRKDQDPTILITNEDGEEEIFDDHKGDSRSSRRRTQRNQSDDRKPSVRFQSTSPSEEERQSSKLPSRPPRRQSVQDSVTPSGVSSTTLVTPNEPVIDVTIGRKPKPTTQTRTVGSRTRREGPVPVSQTPRVRRPSLVAVEPNESRVPIRSVVPDATFQRSGSFRPNNTATWDSYRKREEMEDQRKKEDLSQSREATEIIPDYVSDPFKTFVDNHRREAGFYRMRDRRVLIPHKITLEDVFGDQSHLTVNRRMYSRPTSFISSTMQLLDLDQNKRQLRDVESVNLLSSLVIRALQIHRKHVPFIPGLADNQNNSLSDFSDVLTISQMQLHSSSLQQSSFQLPNRLPPIVTPRPSSAETNRIRTEAQSRATRAGVNVQRAQEMEDLLAHLLPTDREQVSSTWLPSNLTRPIQIPSHAHEYGVSHAWVLENLLRVQGRSTSRNHVQQILRMYPKFGPLLNSRVPENLIPAIWNDPVVRQLAAVIGNNQNESKATEENLSTEPIKRSATKPTVPTFDDEHSSNFFDYTAPAYLSAMQQQRREEQQKKVLPPVRGLKMPLPRHVLKFGFRELEFSSPEVSIETLRDENVSKARRRRIYMHLMFTRHELLKSQLRQMLKTDYRTKSYLPIISRPPMCN